MLYDWFSQSADYNIIFAREYCTLKLSSKSKCKTSWLQIPSNQLNSKYMYSQSFRERPKWSLLTGGLQFQGHLVFIFKQKMSIWETKSMVAIDRELLFQDGLFAHVWLYIGILTVIFINFQFSRARFLFGVSQAHIKSGCYILMEQIIMLTTTK